MPMNIDIEYSFSPKLLIKSIHTIIDNYESVKGDVNDSNEKRYANRDASHSYSIGKANYHREHKDTNISKIFNSIFKNNHHECEFSLNKNEFNSMNSEFVDDFSFKNQDSPGDNSRIQNRGVNDVCKDTRLEFLYKGSNCLKFSPDRPATRLSTRSRGNNMNRLVNLSDRSYSCDLNFFEKKENLTGNESRIFHIEKIVKFQNQTKFLGAINDSLENYDQNAELNPIDNSDTFTLNPNRNYNSRINNLANKFYHNYSLLKGNLHHIHNGNAKSYHEKTFNSSHQDEVKHSNYNKDNFTSKSKHNSRKSFQKINKTSRKIRLKYMMYTSEEKQFCTDLVTISNYDPNEVANCCQVPLKSLKRWIKVGTKRKAGGGRKVEDPELEGKLLLWIKDTTSKGVKLKYTTIKEKALKLTKSRSFMASKGWFEKFKKKYGLICGRNHRNNNIDNISPE